MDSNRITKTPPLNPMSKATYPEDKAKGEGDMAHCGYEVLDRSKARSRFNADREGMSSPVYPQPRVFNDDY